MYKIVLLRHGESLWNKSGQFTGWTDVDLTEHGVTQAKYAGILLKKEGFTFDLAFTSYLKRATRTLSLALENMDLSNIKVKHSWRLNERHYGALQGENKKAKAKEFGEDQVFKWRRSYDIPPPALTDDDKRHPKNDPLYKDVDPALLPATECLKDTVKRVLPYWEKQISPTIKEGKNIIIAAHGNSLRALVMHLDSMTEEEIPHLNIPTGIPLVYELDENLKPIKHYYLGDQEEIKKAAQAVANQAK